MSLRTLVLAAALCGTAVIAQPAHADENLFGYVRGAETIPQGGWELYQIGTLRTDKGAGHYRAFDYEAEIEYGVSDKFNVSGAVRGMSLDTHGIQVDGYIPGDREFGFKVSGVEIATKYNWLRPAADGIGLSGRAALEYSRIDKHSGFPKDKLDADFDLLAQKYFLDAQLVWVGNLGLEATYAKRKPIKNLPANFEWPTEPEMEIELNVGTGLTYRFAPNWYAGAETQYVTEFETEVGQERWTVFAGPTLHYGSQKWWATLTYFKQLRGGKEAFAEQDDFDLHLIEKTKQEARLKVGFNF
ncbi:DUF6662 family protein [Lysobacter tyrosinilyticus]